ncbi:T9SS type A sorting domain-containing protein [Pontibacter sp. MBLB2868]|uniref:T9SS type A sorting domain-containing protein n=1 Tax=Pontibacter sp. MBLB2868 TaxID=3451555 RepID=UPI003F74C21A
MKTLYTTVTLFTVLFFLCLSQALAQTPGLITKPANNGGQAILDPNGDGYVSKTASGFLTREDEGAAYSEIPYRYFPAMSNEVLGDLNTGTIGGHTDYAPSESSINTGSPAATYFDGKNFMYRMRMGGQSSASKGYSVLIDTDGQFPGGAPNPGFEYEVVLASNFGVQIIKHSATGQEVIFSGSTDQYSQKSVAASRAGGDIDYFYDFYVPLSAFQGGITTSTPLRMSAVTISSAQSGLSGTISDVAGLNFKDYGFDPFKAWLDIINAFPPTSLVDIQTGEFDKQTAVPPVVNDPIYTTSTVISGTSVEAPGSVIDVYDTRTVNGVVTTTKIGQTVVKADGTWVLTGVAPGTLLVNDVITATVTPSNKNTSGISNKVIVLQGACFSVVPPVITGIYNPSGTGLKGISGTSTYNGTQTINIYHSSNTSQVYYTIQFTPAAGASFPYTWNLLFNSNDKTLTSGLYTATITPKGGCESTPSNQICYKSGNSGTLNDYKPTITQVTLKDNTVLATDPTTTTFVPAQLKLLTGKLNSYIAGITIEVLVDGVVQTNVTTVQSPGSISPYEWVMNISNLVLTPGNLISVRSKISSSECDAIQSSASNFLVVTPVTEAPAINVGPYCGLVSYISGTSTAQAGTVIEIYANGVATGKKGSVSLGGKWAVDLSSLAGGGIAPGVQITARAKAVDKLVSPASNVVVSSSEPTGTVTINTVTEGQNFIAGTAPASTTATPYYITVNVDGKAYPEVLSDSNGNWKVSGIDPFDVYPGAQVTASYRVGGYTCPSRPVSTNVVCKQPLKYNIGTNNTSICSGEVVQITLPYSEADVFYNIMNGSQQTGNSVMGTGGAITLTTDKLYASTTLTVVGMKIGSGCSTTMGGSTAVTVNPLPATSGLAFNPVSASASCPGSFSATLSGTKSAYTYQLIDKTGNLVGTPVQGVTGANISLSTGYISSSGTFTVRVSDNITGCGATATGPTFTVTINGPALTATVTPDHQSVCINTTASVIVSTTQLGYTYQLKRVSDNSIVSNAVAGTGAQITIGTYPFTKAGVGTYYVAVRAVGSVCTNDFRLMNEVTIDVIASAVSTASASSDLLCGENLSVTLQGNAPPAGGSGVWRLSSTRYTSGAGVVIASPNSPATEVSGLNSGTYTFTWTVTSSCGTTSTSSTSSITITVNCPAYYQIYPSKYVEQYKNGEVLAVPTDQDNGVVSASLVSGQLLPPGTVLDPATGVIRVSNPSALMPGTYTFMVDLMDGNGFPTRLPVTLRFYGTSSYTTPLPVELLYFTAKLTNDKPVLEWATATVAGNVRFDVERSNDGRNFEKAGSIYEGNESSLQRKYTLTDPKPLYGQAYYRLYQEDTEGKYSYSKIISLVNRESVAANLTVFPNPFTSSLNIAVVAEVAGEATIQIIDMQGKVVYHQETYLTFGTQDIVVTPDVLKQGIYILKLSSAGTNATVKIVKGSN